MDVEYAITLASAASGGAATAAGQSAWQALAGLGRRALGRGDATDAEQPPAGIDPGDEGAVRELTGRIAERARADEAFAADLCRWAETHGPAIRIDRSRVHNSIGGNAQVGKSVQITGDFHGDISL